MITERVEYEVVIDMPSGMTVEQTASPTSPIAMKIVMRGPTTPAGAKQQVRDFVQALRAEVNAP
jgi:hypothetical protein